MRGKIIQELVIAGLFGVFVATTVEAAPGSAPVTVMNTSSAPVPIVGNVGVTGSVTITNTIPMTGTVAVSGTTDVKVVNAEPITVKNSEPARVVIPINLFNPDSSYVYANITLPRKAVLETIALDACNSLINMVAVVNISYFLDPATLSDILVATDLSGEVSIANSVTVSLPTVKIDKVFGLPPTRVDLPVGKYFSFTIANSSGMGISCQGTAVVRYID